MTDPQDERNLALAAIDADALAKDLLKPTRQTTLEDVLDGTYHPLKDHPKPTDERVREVAERLRAGEVVVVHEDGSKTVLNHEINERAATLLEALLTENKALREVGLSLLRGAGELEEGRQRALEILKSGNSGSYVRFYDPSTHVAVPREPTDKALMAFYAAWQKAPVARDMGLGALRAGWAALLTASEEERD